MHCTFLRFGLLALSLSLAGPALADATPRAEAATNVAAVHPTGPAPGKLTPLRISKMGSGLQLAYRIDSKPEVGVPLAITIRLSSRADARVTLVADAGLNLQAPAQVLTVAAGTSVEQVLTVVPQSEGRFYLNLLASSEGRGGATGFAVQVGKGGPMLKPAGKVSVTPSGERVLSIPVK
ncbi:MAG: hypothetical protein LH479_05760 [Polaromonas sp.]|nr:hypothetical protein [Polaromonas sp.]